VCEFVYVCVLAYMYVLIYICMYVFTYVCMRACVYVDQEYTRVCMCSSVYP